MHAICDAATGRILMFRKRSEAGDGQAAYAITGDLPDADANYYPNGTLTPRPAAAAIPTSGTAPLTLDPAIFPAGSTVKIRNEAGQEWTDLDPTDPNDPVILDDAGVYSVRLTAPFPERSFAVEVTLA